MISDEAPNTNIELNVLEFTREELAALPVDERGLLLLLGHIANELSVLNKLHCCSSCSVQQEGILGHTGIMQALVVARMLAGKLLEAWLAIRKSYFDSQLSRKYDPLIGNDGKQALKACGRYFGSTNGILQTRNNVGFHYSLDEVPVGFNQTSADDKLYIYFAEGRGNCLYYASEVVVGTANGSMVGTGDVGLGIRRLLHDLGRVANDLQTFMDECISAIIFTYFGHAEGRLRTEIVSGIRPIDAVRIPYFVAPPSSRDEA